jgi:hypothetical protein
MKSILGIAIAFLTFARCLASAPSDSSVERLVALSITSDMISAMQRSIEATELRVVEQALSTAGLGDKVRPLADELKPKIIDDLRSEFSEENLRAVYCSAYKATYSQQEIDSIVAFLETPAGKAYLAKKSALITNVGETVKGRVGTFTDKVQRDVNAAVEKMQAVQPSKTETK